MISLDEFIKSKQITLRLVDLQKKLMHWTKFLIEVVTDRTECRVKKKYSEFKRLSELLQKKHLMKEFSISHHLKNNNAFIEIDSLCKNLNSCLAMNTASEEKQIQLKTALFNMLFYNEDLKMDQSNELNKFEEISKKQISSNSLKKKTLQIMQSYPAQGSIGTHLKALNPFRKGTDSELPLKQISKEIRKINLVQNGKEVTYGFKIVEGCLLLTTNNILIKLLVLRNLEVSLALEPQSQILLQHPLLKQPIVVRLPEESKKRVYSDNMIIPGKPKGVGQKDKCDLKNEIPNCENLYHEYIALLGTLKECCRAERSKQTKIQNFIQLKITPQRISEQTNSDQRFKELLIKVIHQNICVSCLLPIDQPVTLFLPILNHYGKIQVFMSEAKEFRLLPQLIEHVNAFSLEVQDIYLWIYSLKTKKSNDVRSHVLETKMSRYLFKIEYDHLGTQQSLWSYSASDCFEGEEQPIEFNRGVTRMHINRLKRIAWNTELYSFTVSDLLNFNYPRLSLLLYLLFFIAICLFDGNCIHLYFTVGLILCLLYNHPNAFNGFVIFFQRYESKKKWQQFCTYLLKRNEHNFYVTLNQEVEKKQFLNTFEMKMRKKRNIYKKYKYLQEILLKMQNYLMDIANTSEKLKNLFTWYHYSKTAYLFLGCFLLFFVLILVSLRVLAVVFLLRRMCKGLSYYQQTCLYNQSVVEQIIRLCIKQQGLEIILKYQIKQDLAFDKKQPQFAVFQQKLAQSLKNLLEVSFEEKKIFYWAGCMRELVVLLASCKKKYTVRPDACLKYNFDPKWSARDGALTSILQLVYGYLMGIPSDKFIMGIITPKEEADEQAEDN